VKLLHFPNITPSEQKRLLKMSDSSSASDDEQETPSQEEVPKTQRKKSSTKRSLDLQRKISLNKLKEERKESQTQLQNNVNASDSSSSPPLIESPPSVPPKHSKHRFRNGKLTGGYEQYNLSLLHVPMPKDYGDPSSDDLSSEWESDVPTDKAKESKVSGGVEM
jgi:hypothetical protein